MTEEETKTYIEQSKQLHPLGRAGTCDEVNIKVKPRNIIQYSMTRLESLSEPLSGQSLCPHNWTLKTIIFLGCLCNSISCI